MNEVQKYASIHPLGKNVITGIVLDEYENDYLRSSGMQLHNLAKPYSSLLTDGGFGRFLCAHLSYWDIFASRWRPRNMVKNLKNRGEGNIKNRSHDPASRDTDSLHVPIWYPTRVEERAWRALRLSFVF